VFRGNEQDGYPFLKKPFFMNYVAVAAYRDPPRNPKNSTVMDAQHTQNTAKKIRTLLSIAVENGHDAIILGALGCGAFKNPAEQVASLFYTELKEFSKFFKRIVFAIFDDSNSIHNRTGNVYTFVERFRVPLKTITKNVRSLDICGLILSLGISKSDRYSA
jgi:uncharacterized protein (TIGR02452 family)